ncbi:hypothetical protein ABZ078_12175 [Streptomyces sp. NPDC006385]|uniref:hypothetical protein n=1 Tax=Streptomyces sp. NPDC006385 TaxID=3156761 RepID=UPI0033BCED76
MEMVFHRAESEELRDKTSVGVSGWLHSSVHLELVDQVGKECSVDARDDFEHATISVAPAVEEDLLAGHMLIVAAHFFPAPPDYGGQSWPGREGCGGWLRGGDAETDNGPMVATPVDLSQFVLCAGEADMRSFNLAEPAFALGLGDAGDQVVADLDQSVASGGVGPEHRAADAGVLVDAGGSQLLGP